MNQQANDLGAVACPHARSRAGSPSGESAGAIHHLKKEIEMKRQKRFEVKVSLDGAAFDADLRPELRRILTDLVDRLHNSADAYRLTDENGNAVGTAAFGKAAFRTVGRTRERLRRMK
jgi:hypothetical protein